MSIRVFHSGPLEVGSTLELDDAESHYLLRVRRASVGSTVDVLDGVCSRATAELIGPLKPSRGRCATVKVTGPSQVAANLPVTIAIGMPQKPALLEAISRACEAGADQIVLLDTEFSQKLAPSPERIQRIVRSAQRQCGRPAPPAIHGPTSLNAWLGSWVGPGFVADPMGAVEIKGPLAGPAAVLLGPEGGLSAPELAAAASSGFVPLGLGPFVLRTEVAVTSCIARLLPVLPSVHI